MAVESFDPWIDAVRACVEGIYVRTSASMTQNAIYSEQIYVSQVLQNNTLSFTHTSYYSASGTSVAVAEEYLMVVAAPIVVGTQHYHLRGDRTRGGLARAPVMAEEGDFCGHDSETDCVMHLHLHSVRCCLCDTQRRRQLRWRTFCLSFFACSCASSR